MLGRKAIKIFTGTGGMEKFFPEQKIMVTGNPVRMEIAEATVSRSEGLKFFSLDEAKKTVLVVGGSLGARSINEAINKGLDELLNAGLQIIWQTGKSFSAKAKQSAGGRTSVRVNEFIMKMEYAYAAADIVVARAGAMTVAELCVVKKPVLFVPYPFAAENHQMENARLLENKHAAMIVKDSEAMQKLVFMTIELSMDQSKQEEMKKNISELAIINADKKIAEEIIKHFR
jgi:UDP-N-acetylglucosamine--N-acetylmuramyl-(pentapeptide) pyrophosphoryl-undecaprenol N-acetylglucosamine transferase